MHNLELLGMPRVVEAVVVGPLVRRAAAVDARVLPLRLARGRPATRVALHLVGPRRSRRPLLLQRVALAGRVSAPPVLVAPLEVGSRLWRSIALEVDVVDRDRPVASPRSPVAGEVVLDGVGHEALGVGLEARLVLTCHQDVLDRVEGLVQRFEDDRVRVVVGDGPEALELLLRARDEVEQHVQDIADLARERDGDRTRGCPL